MEIRAGDEVIWGEYEDDEVHIASLNLNRTVIGIQSTSFCEEGKNILMLDYDNLDYDEVIKDISRLQEKWDLPDMYIFRSSHKDKRRFHVYCFTPLERFEHLQILYDSKVDVKYKSIFLHQGKSTLRITPKLNREKSVPELIEVVKNKSSRKEIEKAPILLNEILSRVKE